jgi:serine/threonine protein phosphatase 1
MRLLAIGDIHGCSRAFDALLAAVELRPGDRLVTLGDYVDRGPDSRGVLDQLLALDETGWLIALRGNHDVMMMEARRGALEETEWRLCGGNATLASYVPRGTAGQLKDVPPEHWEFLERKCLDWYEADTHFFVHANVQPDVPLAKQLREQLHWEKLDTTGPHVSGKVMVCGHTQQRSGMPLNLGHAVCIDTWAYGLGWLTCLDVASGHYWQANQTGRVRTGWLEDQDEAIQ